MEMTQTAFEALGLGSIHASGCEAFMTAAVLACVDTIQRIPLRMHSTTSPEAKLQAFSCRPAKLDPDRIHSC